MHAKFNLNGDYAPLNLYLYMDIGKSIYERNKSEIELSLSKFKDANGVLEAEKIVNCWFPSINADVFLSHSHKDEETVFGLAGWLKDKFGLRSFIDSAVWGYSDRLLRVIDNEYCMNDSGSSYMYELRNRSTSHVHMMLSTALSHMIDKCECVVFVNTPNSFKPVDYLHSKGNTESPWIYSEIAMTKIIRTKSPEEHRPKISKATFDHAFESLSEELKISYPLDVLHLTPLSAEDLIRWGQSGKRDVRALDFLYDMKSRGLIYG